MCGFETPDLGDIEVAVGEALANAVEHGTRDLGFITVTCSYGGDGLLVEIRDEGTGFDHAAGARRDPRSIRGFGISLMRSLMDDVRYLASGNVVQLFKAGPRRSATSRTLPMKERA
jgi:anti-sigma regulatory factor (Ser/Thr protein kinase)